MITSLRLVDFKNFADETLRMGPFTVIVGANASGKSNVRDALRFLHGIGRGYALADIVGGKYGVGGQLDWPPIRGAAKEIVRFLRDGFSLEIELKLSDKEQRYSIKVERGTITGLLEVKKEEFIGASESLIAIRNNDGLRTTHKKEGWNPPTKELLQISPNQSALTQFLPAEKPDQASPEVHLWESMALLEFLGGMRFLDPSPELMRQPSFPGQTRLGDGGENLPTVLQSICSQPERQETLTEWLCELTPMDVLGFDFEEDPSGRIHLFLKEANERKVSAYSASDGTLRFLAILAALLDDDPARLYVFEEIDNGIHPLRLRLLLELIERQTERKNIQVITTTHSPELLSMVGDRTFENTSVICRLPDSDNAIVRPVAELPNAIELRRSQSLGRLHASGWFEDAVYFAERDNQASE